ncbi:MAG: SDR family NAD(P)-dependent oxidoreductase, partial [Chloroflexota bacterium]
QAVEQIVAKLEAQEIETRSLNASQAFHSPLIEPMLAAFEEAASKIDFQPLQRPLVSNLTGQLFPVGYQLDATYWRQHTRESVNFMAGIKTLFAQSSDVFIEIGPKPILLTLGKSVERKNRVWLPSLMQEVDNWSVLFDSLATLWTIGGEVNWQGLYQSDAHQRLSLPTYPFQRKRYWISTKTEAIIPMDTIQTDVQTSSTLEAKQAAILSRLRRVAAEWLRVDPSEVDPTITFQDLGAGSIMMVDTIREIDQTFGIRIKAQRFFEDLTTLEALAAYLAEQVADEIPVAEPQAPPASTDKEEPSQSEAPPPSASVVSENIFYQMQWHPAPLVPIANEVSPGHWFILSDRQGIAQQLSSLLEAQGQTTTLLGLSAPHQIKRLLSDLLENTEHPCRGIVYLSAVDQRPSDPSIPQLLASEVEHQLEAILALIQTLAEVKETPAPHLWVVTQAAQPVQSTHPIAVEQAPLWGLGRTCAIEQPELWGGMVDLAPHTAPEESAQQLLHTLLASDGEHQVAFRQTTRYVARLVPVEAPRAAPLALRAEASYLVTGGLKGLGYEVTRWLVQKGAQHLILLGRTPLSEAPLLTKRIGELEQLGACVHYSAVDVANARQVNTFFKRLLQMDLPPIRGVVHCASVWQDQKGDTLVRPLLQLGTAELSAVLQPKVVGTLHLAQHLTNTLDFFTCFSSGVSLIGSVAQGNYAAANAFLDAMAHHLSGLGQPTTSINWGAISDIGFGGTPEGQKLHDYWEQEGIGRISPTQMLAALEHLHAYNVAQVAVMNIDWSRLFQTHPALADMAWGRDIFKEEQPLEIVAQAAVPASMEDKATQPSAQPVPLSAQIENGPVLSEQRQVSANSDNALVQLMGQQLEVMSQQLELLRANNLADRPQPRKKKRSLP